MRKSVLDTNVLLRFFVGDNAAYQKRAHDLFYDAEKGRRSLVVLPVIVAETVFVLESFYKQSRDAIAEILEVFLSQRWLDVPERDVLLLTLDYYRNGEHFVDCYLSAWSECEQSDLVTFDNKLQRRRKK